MAFPEDRSDFLPFAREFLTKTGSHFLTNIKNSAFHKRLVTMLSQSPVEIHLIQPTYQGLAGNLEETNSMIAVCTNEQGFKNRNVFWTWADKNVSGGK